MEKSTELDFAQIMLLADAVPVPLVLHGSSGVSHENLKRAIKTGIKKINMATELNMVFGASIKKNLDLGPADPRKFLVPARTDLATHLINLYRAVAP
jgi:fructose-bisphosphate aldolase, class II